jgi:Cu2+-exporting ATPase
MTEVNHSQHQAHADHAEHTAEPGHAGHGGHGDHVAQFRRMFWTMLVLAIPTVALSGMFAMILGYTVPDFPGSQWVSPVLGTVMYLWGGRPFLTGAVSEIRSRTPGMILLIGLAITVAFVSSWGASLGVLPHNLDFWWELALLIVIMLLGHWIEMRSVAQTTSALDSLAALLPDEAERVTDEGSETVAPADLRVDDVVIVRPGASVPADGVIVDGAAEMDESMVTGESRPVRRSVGDAVVATDSGLRVKVTAVGDDTALAGIQRLVTEAQNSSSRAQRLADRAAAWLFWFALGAAIVTAVVWGHHRAARSGRDSHHHGGEPTVTAVAATGDRSKDELLAIAAAAESDSEHPLARAIVDAARRRGLTVPASPDFTSSPAVGVTARVDGNTVRVGGPRLLEEAGNAELPAAGRWRDEGAIILHVLVEKEGAGPAVAGALALADEVREESRQAVDALHKLGIEVVMITGDAQAVAGSVAAQLGIDRVFAGVRPEDKAAKVAALQDEGLRVVMVGDGVNDAPALAQADVGIAIGAGTDVAIASAGVILASSDPRSVLSVIQLSKASYRKMKQNLWWAVGYNLISVPLAAGVLAPIGFVMPMSVGAILMSISTVVVALNAQLLRRLDLRPEASVRAIL